MARAEVIFMVARQRSGTNPLREVLGGHPEVFCTPEIFHANPTPGAYLEMDMNFFEFLERHPQGTVRRAQSSDVQEQIFLDYLDFLRDFTDKRYLLLDVKFNSMHHFDGPWRAVSDPPALLNLIATHRMRRLHLTRRNYLRYYLSWRKAQTSKAWTAEGTGPIIDPQVDVDLEELLWIMDFARREDEVIHLMLGERPFYRRFDYVDLFPEIGAPVSADVLADLSDWLQLESPFTRSQPRYRKQSVQGLRETIANYDEVEHALRGTVFEHCLEDESMYTGSATGPA